MKNQSLLKRFERTAIVLLLCLAMVLTCFSFVMPVAFAANEDDTESSVPVTATLTDTIISKGIKLPKECDYGDSFEVAGATGEGASVKVTAPDGTPVLDAAGTVKATQVGNYKVTYTNDGVDYDFYVRVRLGEDFFLKVEHNGADIPTYIEHKGTIKLPEAHIYYYNESNILTEYDPTDYEVTVTVSGSNTKTEGAAKTEYAPGEDYVVPNATGKVFITYTAKVGKDGTKHFSQTFTVNVQAKVTNSGNPSITVSGVQKDASVNRAVTLPKATATDNYDDNVKIVITVTDNDGNPVRNVDIDEDGYAIEREVKEGVDDTVKFDNDQAMTFYPTQKGTYTIRYTAYNDAYTEGGNVGKSGTREFYMEVSDLVAPVFKNVEDYEYLIPETWGLKVYKGSEEGKSVELGEDYDGKITFKVPEIVDNNKEESNKLAIQFRVTDADSSKTVVEFKNILSDTAADKTYNYGETYTKLEGDEDDSVVFDAEHDFVLDFNRYKKVDPNDSTKTLPVTGTYTVLFRASDSANNTSSKTYTITLKDSYEDLAAPTTAEVTVPKYLSAADETFTVPYPSYADASDSRPKVDYILYTDADNYLKVSGGEVADVVTEKGEGETTVRKLVFNKGKTNEKVLVLGDKLYFYVGVTDKVGNFTSNAESKVEDDVTKNINVVEDASQYVNITAVTEILDVTNVDIKYDGTNMKSGTAAVLQAGNSVTLGGFSIETSEDMCYYTGFEVAAYDPDGNVLNVTLETSSVIKEGKATIYVRNLKFNLPIATTAAKGEGDSATPAKNYTVTVRVFDVNGNSEIYAYTLANVEDNDDDYITASTVSTIGTTGNVNITYKLHNETISGKGSSKEAYRVIRKISGPVFSLMGSEFTAKRAGSYSVQDGYIKADDVPTYDSFDGGKVNFAGLDQGSYKFSVSDESAPVIEVQDIVPTYAELNSTVKLPKFTAFTENGVAKVDIEVKDPDSRDVDFDDESNSFKADKNGKYTVTVTATYNNASPATATYEISVGDVEAPDFTVVGGKKGTAKVGDSFSFGEIKLADGESSTGVTVTKKLIAPSYEEVTDATISGSFGTYANKNSTSYTFNTVGDYEVIYTVTDAVGNYTTQRVVISVVSSGSSTPTTWTTLSTVLIVVAIVLLAGVIVYVVRFRKVKK